MNETLNCHINVGESYESLTPVRQENKDGGTFVADEDGGTALQPAEFTVLEIIERPSEENKAAETARDIWGRISPNQTLIDGKLVFNDNPRLAPRFDPTKFYVVEQ